MIRPAGSRKGSATVQVVDGPRANRRIRCRHSFPVTAPAVPARHAFGLKRSASSAVFPSRPRKFAAQTANRAAAQQQRLPPSVFGACLIEIARRTLACCMAATLRYICNPVDPGFSRAEIPLAFEPSASTTKREQTNVGAPLDDVACRLCRSRPTSQISGRPVAG